MMRHTSGLLLVLPGIIALGLASCTQDRPQTKQHLVINDEGHGLHSLNNERLRLIMDDLRALDFEEISDSVTANRRDQERLARAARAAASLASDARLIPTIFKEMEMSDESRRVFDGLSAQLHDQCRSLEAIAQKKDVSKMKAQIDAVIATCNACHASFRGPTMAWAPLQPDVTK